MKLALSTVLLPFVAAQDPSPGWLSYAAYTTPTGKITGLNTVSKFAPTFPTPLIRSVNDDAFVRFMGSLTLSLPPSHTTHTDLGRAEQPCADPWVKRARMVVRHTNCRGNGRTDPADPGIRIPGTFLHCKFCL